MTAKYYPHLVAPNPSVLAGQFVLRSGKADVSLPAHWEVDSIGSWTLATHRALPRTPIVDAQGQNVGWLLGDAIDPSGLVRGKLELPASDDEEQGYERLAGRLAGRFLLVFVVGPKPRVYPDALGMLGAVYAPELGVVASTSGLVPMTPTTAFDVPRIMAVGAPYRSSMYPVGLTPRRGIERVMPNHYLDLSTWQLVRRWPLGKIATDGDPVAAQRRVAQLASHTIRSLAAKYRLQCPITAGRDSRLLVACSRDIVDRMTFFTAQLPGEYTGFRDVAVAKVIAQRVGLSHTLLRHQRARPSDLREWVSCTGGEAGEVRGWQSFRTFKQIDAGSFLLNGWAGDVVRPIFWASASANDTVTASNLLSLCGVPERPEFVERAERWLATVPTKDPITTLDLFFIEQRGGCWEGAIDYMLSGYTLGNVAPLCSEEIVRMLVSLPEQYRRQLTFESDVIAREWPELAEIPFNEQVPATSLQARYYLARDRLRAVANRAKQDPFGLPGRVFNKLAGGLSKRTT